MVEKRDLLKHLKCSKILVATPLAREPRVPASRRHTTTFHAVAGTDRRVVKQILPLLRKKLRFPQHPENKLLGLLPKLFTSISRNKKDSVSTWANADIKSCANRLQRTSLQAFQPAATFQHEVHFFTVYDKCKVVWRNASAKHDLVYLLCQDRHQHNRSGSAFCQTSDTRTESYSPTLGQNMHLRLISDTL